MSWFNLKKYNKNKAISSKSQAAPSTFGEESLKTRMNDFFPHANTGSPYETQLESEEKKALDGSFI
jgi:hypothetical protein